MSLCRLNNVKHKEIIDDMVKKGFLERKEESWGSKIILKYKISKYGMDILQQVLEPYEELFPREDRDDRS